WFLGEFTWGFYEIFLGVEAPVTSAADIFWLAGYPLLIIGISLVWNSTKMKVNSRRMISSAVLSALLLVICVYLSTPALTSTDLSLPEKVTTAGYIIGDAGLLITVIVTMVHIPSKELFRLWVAILAALALITAADVLYTYFLSSYFTGHIIDVLWDLGYILLAFGFFNYAVKYRKVLDIVFKNID
ncbi:MAG: hypothetical protein H5T49_04790, partial [Hadesarchaea archaeon]|nr:hypothetical protein [Hadesarchaea archaeon]